MMTPKQIDKKIADEIKHISKDIEPQKMLRVAYGIVRRKSLVGRPGAPSTAQEVLQLCINVVKKRHPHHAFKYDREFFEDR